MTPKIRDSRLANRERHRPTARISRRKSLSLPKRDRIPMQVGEPRFIEQVRANDRSVISLSRREKECLVLDNWATDRTRALIQLVRDIHRVDGDERTGRYATRHGWRAEAFGRKRLCLPAAGSTHEQSFAVDIVGA